MQAHMLFTSASHLASLTSHIQTPETRTEMVWSWEWAAVNGSWKTVMFAVLHVHLCIFRKMKQLIEDEVGNFT